MLEAKKWFHDLQANGRGSSSIAHIRGVLRPAFKHAADNDLIRKNPFDFPVFEVIVDDTVHRNALTPKQTRYFLNFIKNDKHFSKYYYPILVLFRTGLRISEFCGLTLSNIDMKNKLITVDHQLQKEKNGSYFIEVPKTKAGTRVVPMTDEVYEAFKVILAERKQPETERIIDGYSGFIFHDKNGNPTVAMHWINYFRHIVEKHDSIYAKKLPPITPHIARHTFITDMARKRMDARHLQAIAGHSDISITYQVYTHLNSEDVQNEVSRIENENSDNAN